MFNDFGERHFGLGDIVSKAFKIYTHKFKDLLAVMLMIHLPVSIIFNVVIYTFNDNVLNDPFSFIVVQFLIGVVGIIATMGVIYITKATIFGDEAMDYKEAISRGFKRWGSGLLTMAVFLAIVWILSLFFVIPGIIWLYYYVFALQVVVIIGVTGKEALDYSKSLVKGNWWRVFGYLLVISLIQLSILFSLSYTMDIILVLFGTLPVIVNIIIGILQDTISYIIMPFSTIATTIYFINLATLKYGNLKCE